MSKSYLLSNLDREFRDTETLDDYSLSDYKDELREIEEKEREVADEERREE